MGEKYRHHSGRESEVNAIDLNVINAAGVDGIIRHTHVGARKKIFVSKEFKLAREDAEEQFEAYKSCKEAGLPVPTTYRLHDSEKKILMTDLTKGGQFYILSNNNTDIDRALTIEELDSLSRQMIAIAEQATRAHIMVGFDAYFWILKKEPSSEEPRVILVDYGMTSKVDLDEETERQLFRYNLQQALESLAQIVRGAMTEAFSAASTQNMKTRVNEFYKTHKSEFAHE